MTLSKERDSQKKKNWKAKLKVTAKESVGVFFFFFLDPLKLEMLSRTNRVQY